MSAQVRGAARTAHLHGSQGAVGVNMLGSSTARSLRCGSALLSFDSEPFRDATNFVEVPTRLICSAPRLVGTRSRMFGSSTQFLCLCPQRFGVYSPWLGAAADGLGVFAASLRTCDNLAPHELLVDAPPHAERANGIFNVTSPAGRGSSNS